MLDEEGRKSLKEGIYMQTRKVTRDVISGVKGFKSIYLGTQPAAQNDTEEILKWGDGKCQKSSCA